MVMKSIGTAIVFVLVSVIDISHVKILIHDNISLRYHIIIYIFEISQSLKCDNKDTSIVFYISEMSHIKRQLRLRGGLGRALSGTRSTN